MRKQSKVRGLVALAAGVTPMAVGQLSAAYAQQSSPATTPPGPASPAPNPADYGPPWPSLPVPPNNFTPDTPPSQRVVSEYGQKLFVGPYYANFYGQKVDMAEALKSAPKGGCTVWIERDIIDCFRTRGELAARERELGFAVPAQTEATGSFCGPGAAVWSSGSFKGVQVDYHDRGFFQNLNFAANSVQSDGCGGTKFKTGYGGGGSCYNVHGCPMTPFASDGNLAAEGWGGSIVSLEVG